MKLDPALLKRVADLSEKIGEPQSTVMRMSMRIGLDQLEKVYSEQPQKIAYSGLEQSPNHSEEPPKKKKNAA